MNHEHDEFSRWRTQRELRAYLSTIEPRSSSNLAWYAAGGLCAALILAALTLFL